LNEIIKKVRKRDIMILMGNMNAKVGSNNEGVEQVMGMHGLDNMNENGEIFINFCANYDLVVGGMLFPYKRCHKIVCVPPEHITENQIHHIAVGRKFRRSLTNVRNKWGADAGSDHHLVVAEFQLKIIVTGKKFETT
jgi:endonuclease/exonuclease/phosphatase family metal-dependent hydrolase